MQEILINCLCISAWCLGVHSSTKPGFLLGFLTKRYYERKAKLRMTTSLFHQGQATEERVNSFKRWYDELMKPIFSCLICMSSVHTILILGNLKTFSSINGCVSLIFHIFVVAGINSLISKFFE